jgi:hypothetical protein
MIGISLCSLLLAIFNIISLFYGVFFSLLTFLLTLPFSLKILKKDFIVGIFSPFIIILRNISIGLGIVNGIKILLKK